MKEVNPQGEAVIRCYHPPHEHEGGRGKFKTLEEVEKEHIAAALAETGGVRRKAAQILKIARSTLLAKIRRYGLE